MPKIWLKNVRVRERGESGQEATCATPWGRPWGPRPETLSGPVRPTRPPRDGWCGPLLLALKTLLSPPFNHFSFPPNIWRTWRTFPRNSAVFFTILVLVLWSYLSHTNSKSIDSKAKIVGLEKSYKPQAFLEGADFVIVLSSLIFSTSSRLFVQLLLFQFHLWSSLDRKSVV